MAVFHGAVIVDEQETGSSPGSSFEEHTLKIIKSSCDANSDYHLLACLNDVVVRICWMFDFHRFIIQPIPRTQDSGHPYYS